MVELVVQDIFLDHTMQILCVQWVPIKEQRKAPPPLFAKQDLAYYSLASSPPIPLEPPITFFSLPGRSQKGRMENLHTTHPSPHAKGGKYAHRAYTYARRRTHKLEKSFLISQWRGGGEGGEFPDVFIPEYHKLFFFSVGEKWRSRFDILPFPSSSPQLMIFSFISREKEREEEKCVKLACRAEWGEWGRRGRHDPCTHISRQGRRT